MILILTLVLMTSWLWCWPRSDPRSVSEGVVLFGRRCSNYLVPTTSSTALEILVHRPPRVSLWFPPAVLKVLPGPWRGALSLLAGVYHSTLPSKQKRVLHSNVSSASSWPALWSEDNTDLLFKLSNFSRRATKLVIRQDGLSKAPWSYCSNY